jgi:flagellar hook-associated protein 3 FlgL
MRVSTLNFFNLGLGAMNQRQADLAYTSLQLAAGTRILTPADDPIGAARALAIDASLAATDQYQKNIAAAASHLTITEGTLNSVIEGLQRARELAVQGNNGTLSDADRQAIAGEVRQLTAQLLDLANTKDANGEYLFAGLQSHTQPFAPDGSGGYSYAGDDEQRQIQIGANRFVAWGNSGAAVFRDIPTGNGSFVTAADPANAGSGVIDAGTVTDAAAFVADDYTLTFVSANAYEVRDSGGALVSSGAYANGGAIAFGGMRVSVSGAPAAGDGFSLAPSVDQDLFTTAERLAQVLENPIQNDGDRAQLNNAINRTLVDLDQALEVVETARASVGTRLQTLDSQQDLHDASILERKSALSDIRDLDYAEAVSRLQLQRTGLQAAERVFAQLYRLSLFDFIR